MPLMATIGTAYKVRENWTLAGDFEFRLFDGKKINVRTRYEIVPGAEDIETFEEVDPLWKNAWSIRSGTEYVWQTGNRIFPAVPLRAGFHTFQLPAPDIGLDTLVSTDPLQPETTLIPTLSAVQAFGFSLGTGVKWSQIQLDIGYTLTSYNRDALARRLDGDYFLVEQKSRQHLLRFQFTGVF
jgi:hypothetical protein